MIRITTTTVKISIRVKPWAEWRLIGGYRTTLTGVRAPSRAGPWVLHPFDDFDERHEERDNNRADNKREEDDHERLQERGQTFDRIIDFIVVDLGDLQEHLGQLPRFFTDVHHGDYHGRE